MPRRGGAFVYHEADSFFHRLHPATKLLYTLSAIGIVFTIQHPLVLLVLFLIEILVAVSSRMSRTMVTLFVALIGTGALMMFVVWLPFGGDVGSNLVHIPLPFGVTLTFTDLGLMWAPAMGLRILASSLPVFMFLSTTKPRDITIGLSYLGLSPTIGTLFVMALRFVPMVQNDSAIITEAQKARGLDLLSGGVADRVRKVTAILAPLIFTSLRRIQLVANSLDAKGFRSTVAYHRFYKKPQIRLVDAVIITVSLLAFAFAIYCRTQGWAIIIPSRV
jgi:energy-coupling factor transport system permease protein